MKFKKQNQHGAWAMVFMPLVIGIFANGFHLSQLFFMLGWLMIFFAADHVLFFIKNLRKKQYEYLKTALLFILISAVLFIYPLMVEYRIIFFFFLMIPFGLVNAYFSKQRDERNIINDIVAIVIFSIAGGGISFLGSHALNFGVWFTMIITFLYFIGVTLVVKTVIREKNNPIYKWASFIYHAVVFIVMLFIHYILGLAFLFGLIRAVYVYGRGWTPKKTRYYGNKSCSLGNGVEYYLSLHLKRRPAVIYCWSSFVS